MNRSSGRNALRYQKVYQELRSRVLSGRYEPGMQIETEPELNKQFRVSTITVRQAVGMLEEEGLLDRQQGRGTFVPEAVRGRLKVLAVVGLSLSRGLQHRMGSYHSDLVLLSEQETARLGMEFEAVWLDARTPERIQPYLDGLRDYWGFIFIACRTDHPLLNRVRELGLRYVIISPHAPGAARRVWLDFPEAIRLGLGVFGGRSSPPPLIMGLQNLESTVETVLQEGARKAPQVYLPARIEVQGYDTAGYQRTLELHRDKVNLSRILLLDDVVAQGVTRALLKLGYGPDDVKLAVICGSQEIIPLGLPVTYIVHDTDEEVRRAFEILQQKPDGQNESQDIWRSGFRVVTQDG